jgi:BarA-like signal transduction histidine kinase
LDEAQDEFKPLQPHKNEYNNLPLSVSPQTTLAPLQYVHDNFSKSLSKTHNVMLPVPVDSVLTGYAQFSEATKDIVLKNMDTNPN